MYFRGRPVTWGIAEMAKSFLWTSVISTTGTTIHGDSILVELGARSELARCLHCPITWECTTGSSPKTKNRSLIHRPQRLVVQSLQLSGTFSQPDCDYGKDTPWLSCDHVMVPESEIGAPQGSTGYTFDQIAFPPITTPMKTLRIQSSDLRNFARDVFGDLDAHAHMRRKLPMRLPGRVCAASTHMAFATSFPTMQTRFKKARSTRHRYSRRSMRPQRPRV